MNTKPLLSAFTKKNSIANSLLRKFFSESTINFPNKIPPILIADKEELIDRDQLTKKALPKYYRLFRSQIQYEININPLMEITEFLSDVKRLNYSHFEPNALIRAAWLYLTERDVFFSVKNYLLKLKNLQIDPDDYVLLLFLAQLNSEPETMRYFLHSLTVYQPHFKTLSLMKKYQLYSCLSQNNLFLKEELKELVAESQALIKSGKLFEMLKDPHFAGAFIFFLNNFVFTFLDEKLAEPFVHPKFLNQLSDFFQEEMDLKFQTVFSIYPSALITGATNDVFRGLLYSFLKNL